MQTAYVVNRRFVSGWSRHDFITKIRVKSVTTTRVYFENNTWQALDSSSYYVRATYEEALEAAKKVYATELNVQQSRQLSLEAALLQIETATIDNIQLKDGL